MEGETGPAVVEAPVVETPKAPVASEPTAPATAPVETPPSAPTQPDYKALLQDKEFRKALFADPELQQQIVHRANSEAGRRFQAEMAAYESRQKAEAEAKKLREMDPYDLGEYVKKQWNEDDERTKFQTAAYGKVAADLMEFVSNHPDLTPEEKRALHIANPEFDSLPKFLSTAVRILGKKEGAKLGREYAKVEAEALVKERLAAEREKEPQPVALSPGTATSSDSKFLEDYRNGTSNDHARYWKLAHGRT